MKSDPPRSPHAALAKDGRYQKGRKIERLLELTTNSAPQRLLEIGTGSGWISHYFAHHTAGRYDVDAVDVVDSRQSKDGYRFTLVTDTALPFADGSFDVVISNHVIEHVGDDEAQARHLAEMRRVMRPDGIGYLAVPNRWMIVEPHYDLPFLSWLPKAWRTPYLRWSGKGVVYDCKPLKLNQLEKMVSSQGLGYENLCVRAFRETIQIEQLRGVIYSVSKVLPDHLLWRLRRLSPTLVFRVFR